ncbi:hypothetical protein GCM10029964_066870 [Kibdelosporangium lantanae]
MSDVTDWSSGFVGGIDITNTGDKALADWTLTFAWPTSRQQVSSGWNATWTQTGATVTVVGNAVIQPGGTVNTGFVGSYSGPNILPAAFTLNGVQCGTA